MQAIVILIAVTAVTGHLSDF